MSAWISVKDRLPDDVHYVLVFHTGCGGCYVGRHVKSIPQWSLDNGWHLHDVDYDSITHWQELPEPPEEQL